MMTLSELRGSVGYVPPTRLKEAPGRKELQRIGGGVVEMALFAEDALIEVYAIGYVYYERLGRWTSFSLQDVFEDYEYDSLMIRRGPKIVIDSEFFEPLPWVIRVLMEGEDRIDYNLSKARIGRNGTSFDTLFDGGADYGRVEEDALTTLLRKELYKMILQSFDMITKHQRDMIEECIIRERKQIDVAEDYDITHQAVKDALDRGIINLRRALNQIYGD